MTLEAANTLLGAAGIIMILAGYGKILPYASKELSLTMLHDIRDDMMALGQKSPWLKRTKLYRSAESLATVSIHVCRYGRLLEVLILYIAVLQIGRAKGPDRTNQEVSHSYADLKRQMDSDPNKKSVVIEFVLLILRLSKPLCLRLLFGNLLSLPIGGTIFVCVWAIHCYRRLIKTPTQALADIAHQAVERVMHSDSSDQARSLAMG